MKWVKGMLIFIGLLILLDLFAYVLTIATEPKPVTYETYIYNEKGLSVPHTVIQNEDEIAWHIITLGVFLFIVHFFLLPTLSTVINYYVQGKPVIKQTIIYLLATFVLSISSFYLLILPLLKYLNIL